MDIVGLVLTITIVGVILAALGSVILGFIPDDIKEFFKRKLFGGKK